MSFEQFADIQDFIVIETGVKQALGAFSLANSMQLSNIKLTLNNTGTPAGNEKIRINLYSTDRYESSFASSDWASISNIDGLTTDWIGWVKLDFNRVGIDSNEAVYAEIETLNYTRDALNFYLGLGLDWPVSFNSFNTTGGAPVAMQIFGYK